MALMGNASLFGPPPGEVLDPVPWEDVVRGIVAGVPDLLGELYSDSRNVVLTLARIWATLVTGSIKSKDAAADWALPRLPTELKAVLARARANYLSYEAEEPADWAALTSQLRSYASHVTIAIEELTALRD
jgi:streptomycin 3"-adenylyltransferase